MKIVSFYGVSDDLMEVEGDIPGCDEYDGDRGSFLVCGLRVKLAYSGCWGIAVEQIDESVKVEASVASFCVHENGYSMYLCLAVPDGSYIGRDTDDL
jgi:hypothetical protein